MNKGNPLPALVEALKNLRSLELVIEHLPFRELSPNSRVHWAAKARAAKAQREEVGWLCKAQWGNQSPMTHARISYTFVVTDKRHRDIDNLVAACKSFQDGLVDGGVLVSDTAEHLTWWKCVLQQGNKEQTIIELAEILK